MYLNQTDWIKAIVEDALSATEGQGLLSTIVYVNTNYPRLPKKLRGFVIFEILERGIKSETI